MKNIVRWIVVAIVTLHGLIHLMGTAEGFGLADLDRVDAPVGAGTGSLWLVAALAVLAAAAAIAARRPSWWWAVAATAAVVSQAVIFTRWSDASAGTAANVLLLLVAGYAFATRAPHSVAAADPSLDDVAGDPVAVGGHQQRLTGGQGPRRRR